MTSRREFLKKIGYVTAASVVPLGKMADTPQPELTEAELRKLEREAYPIVWADLTTMTVASTMIDL